MENLISELCEILEVSELPIQSPFSSMEEWDSLNALTVLSMLDSYGLTMEAEALEEFESISKFLEYVLENKK
jgi:acyl carrier protein